MSSLDQHLLFFALVSLYIESFGARTLEIHHGFRHSNYFDDFLLVVIMYCVYLDMIRR